ncbi:HCNGP-domain-containing protein [Xylona heveae TC161]|uniref:HCNGP-domain-containing protein n=1 Tax=Xylona heveae (strain CBS 132557 / TC161) TaxID=1328760 RepID=A0A161TF76_XYLHT|nr:HCNGP-domain-containing protein [Xylona heveae TC161]KZF24647.1 HCNGP-domain-containing protein [Xylona heveae TC161]
MLGLGAYESSDEEDVGKSPAQQVKPQKGEAAEGPAPEIVKKDNFSTIEQKDPAAAESISSAPPTEPASTSIQEESAVEGPMVGPTGPPASPPPMDGAESRPQSPYSANRSLLRDLTLPTVPNLDIPPSPPGSPPPRTTAKFAHFLQLKREGVHFNDKLSKSSALKNPSLLQKLRSFAGIDDQTQYATTLPSDIWDPQAFPEWAYKEELAKSQQEVLKRKEEEKAKMQREAIDFVPAAASGDSSRVATPGSTGSGRPSMRGSAAERVMAGLDRERTRSPQVQDSRKRKDLERRGGRYEGYRSRDRSRSRSPRRRRSRSR